VFLVIISWGMRKHPIIDDVFHNKYVYRKIYFNCKIFWSNIQFQTFTQLYLILYPLIHCMLSVKLS
jgi:hypothetical protein